MTQINRTNTQTSRPFRTSSANRTDARSSQRITMTQAAMVNDEPIEEVVFEPNSGVDQRARHHGYVITEPVEDVLAQRRDNQLRRDHFWQGFSAPFMAQVIGQHTDSAVARIRTSSSASDVSVDLPQRLRLSTAS